MRRKIVIVECWSTGVNYVEDLLKLGYEPVIVEARQIGEEADVAAFRQVRDAAQKKLPPNIKNNPRESRLRRNFAASAGSSAFAYNHR